MLHVPTIKPLDREAILRAARTDRLVVTLENHTVIGGLAESVAVDAGLRRGRYGASCPIALPDEFLAAGALPTLHDRYGLSTDADRHPDQGRARPHRPQPPRALGRRPRTTHRLERRPPSKRLHADM